MKVSLAGLGGDGEMCFGYHRSLRHLERSSRGKGAQELRGASSSLLYRCLSRAGRCVDRTGHHPGKKR
jgi:asparagine synthetase B (glutamine-hydrolysing)